jgi:hypothetical protein
MSVNARVQGASNTMANVNGKTASKKSSSVFEPIVASALLRTVTTSMNKMENCFQL